jgi:hypothetical protein
MALEHLFDAELLYQPGMAPLAEQGDGVLIDRATAPSTGPRSPGLCAGRSSSSRATSSAP